MLRPIAHLTPKYLWYRLKFHLAPYLPLKGPVHVDIELSAMCQLRCHMCPYSSTFDASKQGMMERDQAERVLREARELGALSCKLNFRGEPGLSPDLIDMVKLAKTLGYVEVSINTNLTAFSHRRLGQLFDAGLDLLIVSCDGATKATYELIRQGGDFDKLCELLTWAMRRRHRPRIRVQMTLQEANQHEVDAFRYLFADRADELRIQPVRSSNEGERKRCPQPYQRLVLMWDGSVGGCCSNWDGEAVISRYPEKSLREIWRTDRKKLLRFAKDPASGGPCKNCLVGGSYK